MPKLKTNRGAAKRFKRTGSGNFKRIKAYHRHILTSKSTKRKRRLRQSSLIDKKDIKAIEKLVPYA